jgi:hypothetical protein
MHGLQFLDVKTVVHYVKRNTVTLYVDNHSDFSNSAKTFFSKFILHKIIWKKNAKILIPYVKKFYGVMPSRVEFLNKIYKINKNKIDLLVMGADDDIINDVLTVGKTNVRRKYSIPDSKFLVVTGGKIDHAKKDVLNLMDAVTSLSNSNIHLLIFGSIDEQIKHSFDVKFNPMNMSYVPWVDQFNAYALFYISDLVVFPGRHSVYWEQCVALQKPLLVKKWDGTSHVDIGGNVRFLIDSSTEEIRGMLEENIKEQNIKDMIDSYKNRASDAFLYSNIARKSLS